MKLSIIITHYNKMPLTEYLLRYFMRNYRSDIEVICIDDCSKDFNLPQDIIESSIRFIVNDKNYGLGYVRQQGLEIASGEYIVYIDADDIIVEDYLSCIMDNLQDADVYAFQSVTYPYGEVLPYKEMMVWNKVYRRKFLLDNNLGFENVRVGEDMLFTPQLLQKNPKIEYINRVLYIYNMLFDSLSHQGCMPI